MTPEELEKLRFPVGPFVVPQNMTEQQLNQCISDIETFPGKLRKETEHLTDDQLDTVYRPDGWTIKQVVHHCADSHMNSFMRFKLTLTEDTPTVKPYFEDRWAELVDSAMPIEPSLRMIEGIHQRWVAILRSLSTIDLKKGFNHPEQGRVIPLNEVIAMYAWHSNHHLAHITSLKSKKGWK
jgi:hypothetical protein